VGPPTSPDLSTLNFYFFFWVSVKEYVYTPSMQQSLVELQGQNSRVTEKVSAATLQQTSKQLQYDSDICCITHGACTEHL
jgi:hypothetical protein